MPCPWQVGLSDHSLARCVLEAGSPRSGCSWTRMQAPPRLSSGAEGGRAAVRSLHLGEIGRGKAALGFD